ncbi:MAG: ISNCY family transposase [Betaproteobacteria bacterium]|nr:ISNCY family transposase [Betaproteobacteria bacterium]
MGELVQADLLGERRADRGRRGLNGAQVLRVALLKQIHGLSYRELEFHLQDSDTFRAFVGLGFGERPSYQALQANVKAIRPQTWEAVHRVLIGAARAEGIERGRVIRGDTTAVDANIHPPSDSALLWDGVRVATRLLKQMARRCPSLRQRFGDHTRRARRRAYEIKFSGRRKDRPRLYRDLIRVAEAVAGQARDVLRSVDEGSPAPLEVLASRLRDVLALLDRVLDQTRRRVLDGEAVPAAEKIVSIFEPHADILVKGQRDVHYGHKVCLTGGRSSLILDYVVEAGNPTDTTLLRRTLERHIDLFGEAPRQACFDGGFASQANLESAKALGVEDIAFHRTAGLEISAMVRSAWVFRRLRNWRSGIEAVISTLKRAFRMNRCTWRGLASFQAYVGACVTSFNLIVLARHRLVREFA